MEYLKIHWNRSEMQDVRDMAETNASFYRNILQRKTNYTNIIKEELLNILYGKIPRNFIINIKNGIGSPTGVFKSSMGLQLAMELDPTFNINERVAFTPNQLNDLIRNNAGRKQVFVLDERIHDLKVSADMRLANIAESCRERQLCIIMIGVSEKFLNISHYHFERFGESNDSYLPNKTVYYVVKKVSEGRKVYRGYITHNITPLSDPTWQTTWEQYMQLKAAHQEMVIQQKVSAFDFETKARELTDSDEFVAECVSSEGTPVKGKIKNFIYKHFPDITNEERKMIYVELTDTLDKYIDTSSEIRELKARDEIDDGEVVDFDEIVSSSAGAK